MGQAGHSFEFSSQYQHLYYLYYFNYLYYFKVRGRGSSLYTITARDFNLEATTGDWNVQFLRSFKQKCEKISNFQI